MENKSLEQIIKARLEKLDKIRELGINPYPYEFKISHSASGIDEDMVNKKVSVAGRIMSLRNMGKAAFSNIQDQSGRLQLYIGRDDVGDKLYSLFKLMDIGDYIGVTGTVFITKTGAVTVKAKKITILSKNLRPIPDIKEKDGEKYNLVSDGVVDKENKLVGMITGDDVFTVLKEEAEEDVLRLAGVGDEEITDLSLIHI